MSVYRPAVHGDVVVVAFTEFNFDGLRNDRGGVAALELQSGKVRWFKYLPPLDGPFSPTATIDPASTNGVAIAGARDGPVHAFSVDDGALLWSLPPIIPRIGTPPEVRDYRPLVATDGVFIVGTTGTTLLGVEPETGNVIWTFEQAFGSTGWVTVDEDEVFVVYGGGQFEVVDVASGRLKWRNEKWLSAFEPAVTDSVVVLAGDGVHAYRR